MNIGFKGDIYVDKMVGQEHRHKPLEHTLLNGSQNMGFGEGTL